MMDLVGIVGYGFMIVGAFGLGFALGRLINSEGAIKYEADLLRFENAKLHAQIKELTDRDAKGRFTKAK